MSSLISASVAYPDLFIAIFNNNDNGNGSDTNNNNNNNNDGTASGQEESKADKMLLLYVQFLFQGFAVVDEVDRGLYLSTIFPLLCSLLVYKTSSSNSSKIGPVSVPLVTLIGKALTSVATSLPDQFRALVGQCGDSEKVALQAAMRSAMQ